MGKDLTGGDNMEVMEIKKEMNGAGRSTFFTVTFEDGTFASVRRGANDTVLDFARELSNLEATFGYLDRRLVAYKLNNPL